MDKEKVINLFCLISVSVLMFIAGYSYSQFNYEKPYMEFLQDNPRFQHCMSFRNVYNITGGLNEFNFTTENR